MGLETKCPVRVDDGTGKIRQSDESTVLLETDELIIRGDARIKVPRSAINMVTVKGDDVIVKSRVGTIWLTLGAEAGKWQKKLVEAPKSMIEKLDVKPASKVWLMSITDESLISEVSVRAPNTSGGRTASACDVVFVQVDDLDQLDRIDRAAKAIVEDGAIWVVHPKGKAGVADTAIFARAKELGLTYTKVARISDTLSAEKLVWPRASRGK